MKGGGLLKNKIYRFLCIFCALSVAMSIGAACVMAETDFNTDFIDDGSPEDEPNGKMSTVYAYVMNDYFNTYGVISDEYPQGNGVVNQEDVPTGVVYGDVVNFDNNDNPYLVIYFVEGGYKVAACHIWSYNEETEKAKRVAILEQDYSTLTDSYGKFELGWNDEKRFIIYSQYQNDELVKEDYYTVIDNDAFEYVNRPESASKSSVMHFNSDEFAPDIDVTNYNKQLGEFFEKLKNTAADSVSYDDISDRMENEDAGRLEKCVANALKLGNFDIAEYDTMEEYKEAITADNCSDRFYLISNVFDLGEELYYVLFSTDQSYYNYTLLRRTEDNAYQVLRVATNCIPLSDRELRQIRSEYSKNTLLMKKAKDKLPLSKAPAETKAPQNDKKDNTEQKKLNLNLPKIEIEKQLDRKSRIPVACIGGGISIALLTLLWVYIYGSDD